MMIVPAAEFSRPQSAKAARLLVRAAGLSVRIRSSAGHPGKCPV